MKCHFTALIFYIVSNWHGVDLWQPLRNKWGNPVLHDLVKQLLYILVDMNNVKLLKHSFTFCSSIHLTFKIFIIHHTNIKLFSLYKCLFSTTSFPGPFSYTDHITLHITVKCCFHNIWSSDWMKANRNRRAGKFVRLAERQPLAESVVQFEQVYAV